MIVEVLLAISLGYAAVEPATPVEQAELNLGILTRATRFKLNGYSGPSQTVNDSNNWQVFLQTPVGPNFIDGTRPWSAVMLTMPNSGSSRTSIPNFNTAVPLRYHTAYNDYSAVVWGGKMLLNENLSIGIGYQFSFSAAGNAETNLGEKPGGRMELSTGPEGAWIVGASSRVSPHDFGLTYTQSHASHVKQIVEANVSVNPGVVIVQPMTLSATTKWEPESVVFNYHYRLSSSQNFGINISWENWRPYELPFLKVETIGSSTGQSSVEMKNIVCPGINWDVRMSKHHFRFDLKASPSPLIEGAANGQFNLLDTDTQIIAFKYAFDLGTRSALSFTTQWDRFKERRIENGGEHTSYFTVGGYAFWLGTSLQLAL